MNLEKLFVIGMTVFTLATLGCKKKESTETAPASSAATTTEFAVGDKVDVKWNGSFWKGEIIAVKSPKYRVHYTGWSASWDEDVTPDRVRAPSGESKVGTEVAAVATDTTPAATPSAATSAAKVTTAASTFKVGDKVDVNWNGQWWAGSILSVSGTSYKVHYTGWAASWDETVPASRVRPPTAGAKKGSGPA